MLSRFSPPKDNWRKAHLLGSNLLEWELSFQRMYWNGTAREKARLHSNKGLHSTLQGEAGRPTHTHVSSDTWYQ